MARKTTIKTVDGRGRLAVRREPYWEQLSSGKYLGYRISSVGNNGTWIARYHDTETKKKPSRALGDFGDVPPAKRFDEAKKAAEEWFRHLDSGGTAERLTVQQVCEMYAVNKPDAAARFVRHVYGDPIAGMRVEKLKEVHLKAWRKRLEVKPVLVTKSPNKPPQYRPRSQSAIKRDIMPLRAALNAALSDGYVTNNNAWRKALLCKREEPRREIYLTKDQRRALLENLQGDDIRDFVHALCLLPLRVGAVAALKVSNFNAVTKSLTVHKDKAGAGRQIPLQGDVVELLKRQSKNKHPTAFLFSRANGSQWKKDYWKTLIKDAAKSAGLPDETIAYAFRHSTITDLVLAGIPILTVAQISGTSVQMIQDHYGHLQEKAAAAAMASLAV